MTRQRSAEQKSKDLRQKSKDLLSLADSLNSNLSDEKCALTCATTALALEQRRTADALERLIDYLVAKDLESFVNMAAEAEAIKAYIEKRKQESKDG